MPIGARRPPSHLPSAEVLNGHSAPAEGRESKNSKKSKNSKRSKSDPNTRNPFKPTAGASPPSLIGRQHDLDGFEDGLRNGTGAPGLLTIITGARGIGKTVMLTEAERLAGEYQWVVISETATAGLRDRLYEAMVDQLEEIGDGPDGYKMTGLSVLGVSVSALPPERRAVGWRKLATRLLQFLDSHGTGLVISIDEIHAIDREELTTFAADIQHFIRQDLPIALVMAGISVAVSDLLNENVSTFLRRADRVDLTDVPVPEVRAAFLDTFARSGLHLTDAQLSKAAQSTEGYPFFIQLVGYHIFGRSSAGQITDALLDDALADAGRALGRTVIRTALSDVSEMDYKFLVALSASGDSAELFEIAERLRRSPSYTRVYRRRMMDAGLIRGAGRGAVRFAIPRLAEFLRDNPTQ